MIKSDHVDTGHSLNHLVLQDYIVPINVTKDVLDASHEEFLIYPIWLCPVKDFRYDREELTERSLYVDVGIYG